MASLDYDDKLNIEHISAITGDIQSRYLYYQLKASMSKAESIDIIVSFLMEDI